jgi:predicted lysophospholipase L1 biosynthesis ABC-type transport system permease subunit
VAVVTQSVAQRFWPNSSPIGQRIKLGSADSPWITVIGISGDVIRDWLTDQPAHLVYVPYTQYAPRSTTFVIRTTGDPDGLARAAQAGIRKVDQDLPILAVKSMNRAMYEETSGVRAAADSMKQYAGVALLLAATGIFGVIAYFVAQRTRDIGVRIALGANTSDVLRMTLRRTLYPTSIGIAIGTAAAYGLCAFMASLLYHLVKLDATTFVGCAALLGGTALLASYLPARKATQVDPLIALREN